VTLNVACGSPATALTMPPADLPRRDVEQLMAAARTYGLDIIEPS
jgi:hypothetical protein